MAAMDEHDTASVASTAPATPAAAAADAARVEANAALQRMRARLSEPDAAQDEVGMEHVVARRQVYADATVDFPTSVGKCVSKRERDSKKQHQATLVYGEIAFDSFGIAFEKLRRIYGLPGAGDTPEGGLLQKPGGVFVDIGAGTGKPCVAAACLHPFERCVGVEILEGLFETSRLVKRAYDKIGKPALAEAAPDEAPAELEFYRGDATTFEAFDWSIADVCFANSTCFDDRLIKKVANRARACRKGAFFVTLTKKIPTPDWTLLEQKMYKMSWGGATVYIHQKNTDPEEPLNNADLEVASLSPMKAGEDQQGSVTANT